MKPRSNFRVFRHEVTRGTRAPKKTDHQIKLFEYDHEFEETMLMDHFIFGLHLKSTQKALLKEGRDLTIASALKVAETDKATVKQMDAICVPLKYG